jgi:hypothetical protein
MSFSLIALQSYATIGDIYSENKRYITHLTVFMEKRVLHEMKKNAYEKYEIVDAMLCDMCYAIKHSRS